jgi:hypothetical protein
MKSSAPAYVGKACDGSEFLGKPATIQISVRIFCARKINFGIFDGRTMDIL